MILVLNELDGLCRSKVNCEARSALDFLRDKNPQVRYVTSKGAILHQKSVYEEEADDPNQVRGAARRGAAVIDFLLTRLAVLLRDVESFFYHPSLPPLPLPPPSSLPPPPSPLPASVLFFLLSIYFYFCRRDVN